MRRIVVAAIALALAACTAGGSDRADAGPRDAGGDGGQDSGPEICASDGDCDDTFGCTIDTCVIGNVCEHMPLDGRCNAAAGEHCVAGRGCVSGTPTDCTTDADCDDGSYCNGNERCLADRCAPPAMAVSCNDGNDCTDDHCDETLHDCRYTTSAGCDAGTASFDGGAPCLPFDPATDYPGTFTIQPSVESACFSANWSIDTLVVTAGSGLTGTPSVLRGGSFTLAQASVPAGADFTLTGVQSGCSRHELMGHFECANRFRGTWRVTFEGSCSACGSSVSSSVVGRRR